jgi:hypothetical protein
MSFSYRLCPPFLSGVFFFARAGWLYAYYENAADLSPEELPAARKRRVANDKVSFHPDVAPWNRGVINLQSDLLS